MKGIDYTKKLNETREQYANNLAENNKAYQKSLEQQRDTHKGVEKNQRQTYVRERDELEGDYKNNVERIRDNTVESLKSKSKAYRENLDSQKEDFFLEIQNNQLKYNTRIAELGEDYNKNVNMRDELHGDIQQRTRDISNEKVGKIKENHQAQVEKFLDETKLSSDEVKRQARKEKRELVREQNQHVHEMRKDQTEKTNFMKDEMRKDIDRMRDIQEKELSVQRANQEKNFEKLRTTTNKKVGDAFENFSDLNKVRTKQQVREIKQNQKNTSEVIEGVKKNYNEDLDDYKAKVERRLEIQTGDDKFALTQMGVKDKNDYEQKLGKHQEKMQDTITGIFDKMEDNRAENQKANQKKSEIFANRYKEQERDFFKMRTEELEKMRKSENKLKDDHEYIESEAKARFSQKLGDQNANSEQRVKNLKENFSATVEDLNKKKHTMVKEMREDTIKDKSSFIKVAREQHADELYSMRSNYRTKLLTMRSELNKKIASLERENNVLKREMQDKVDDLLTKGKLELQFNNEVLDDRISANRKTFDEEKKNMQDDFRVQMFAIREQNEKKMQDMAYKSDRQMKEMTREFQATIGKINHTNLQEKEKMMTEHNRELERLKNQFETEKNMLATQFRSQMDDMQRSYKDQLNGLNDFNERQNSGKLA